MNHPSKCFPLVSLYTGNKVPSISCLLIYLTRTWDPEEREHIFGRCRSKTRDMSGNQVVRSGFPLGSKTLNLISKSRSLLHRHYHCSQMDSDYRDHLQFVILVIPIPFRDKYYKRTKTPHL